MYRIRSIWPNRTGSIKPRNFSSTNDNVRTAVWMAMVSVSRYIGVELNIPNYDLHYDTSHFFYGMLFMHSLPAAHRSLLSAIQSSNHILYEWFMCIEQYIFFLLLIEKKSNGEKSICMRCWHWMRYNRIWSVWVCTVQCSTCCTIALRAVYLSRKTRFTFHNFCLSMRMLAISIFENIHVIHTYFVFFSSE